MSVYADHLWVVVGLSFTGPSNRFPSVTLNKFECFKQALSAVKSRAWNNIIGLRFDFVGSAS